MLIDLNHNGPHYHILILVKVDVMEAAILLMISVFWIFNKIEDVNLKVNNMIKGINVSKTLIKHISGECRCKFDGRKCNSKQK